MEPCRRTAAIEPCDTRNHDRAHLPQSDRASLPGEPCLDQPPVQKQASRRDEYLQHRVEHRQHDNSRESPDYTFCAGNVRERLIRVTIAFQLRFSLRG